MAGRQLSKLVPGLLAACRGASTLAAANSGAALQAPAAKLFGSVLGMNVRSLHTSLFSCEEAAKAPQLYEPSRKFRPLADKELWHEAWMYEDRFGSEEDPIVVPSLEGERIIGVTDPEDDNLVVWGILRDNEPPRQFIENGEFYVLKKVPYIAKVGDVLEQLEAGKAKSTISK